MHRPQCVLEHTLRAHPCKCHGGACACPLGTPGVVLAMDRVPWIQSPSKRLKGLKGKDIPWLQSPMEGSEAGGDENGGGGNMERKARMEGEAVV